MRRRPIAVAMPLTPRPTTRARFLLLLNEVTPFFSEVTAKGLLGDEDDAVVGLAGPRLRDLGEGYGARPYVDRARGHR